MITMLSEGSQLMGDMICPVDEPLSLAIPGALLILGVESRLELALGERAWRTRIDAFLWT